VRERRIEQKELADCFGVSLETAKRIEGIFSAYTSTSDSALESAGIEFTPPPPFVAIVARIMRDNRFSPLVVSGRVGRRMQSFASRWERPGTTGTIGGRCCKRWISPISSSSSTGSMSWVS
jgi:hypothetical protein